MGPDNRRFMIAAALCFAIVLGWQLLFPPPKRPPARAGAPDAGAVSSAAGTAVAPPGGAQAPVPAAKPVPSEPEKLVQLDTPEARLVFSSHGAALKSFELKGTKFRRASKGKDEAVDLVHVAEGDAYPGSMVASTELGGNGALSADPAARASWRVAAQDAHSVTFEGTVGTAEVRKRYTVGQAPYEIRLELHATSPVKGDLLLLYPAFVPPDAPKGGFFSGGEVVEAVTPMCRTGGKTVRFGGKEARETVPGVPTWVGLDQHYFVSALLPTPELGECMFFRGPAAGATGMALRMPLDRTLDVAFRIYKGPKQVDLLRAIGRDLDTAVDYGTVTNLFAFFARILLWVMRTLQSVVRNWGLAIILLTVVVKALLYPLTARSMRSMNEMRKLQPEIDKLKAKFGTDKEKLNAATMQMYQQHKVNPLGGCLPMIIQMPIWFALYATLQTSVELFHEPFLWVRDLTHFDPYYILPLAMGASSFLMQKISPQPADNAQAKMLLYFMPIFFTFIMLRLPAGLTLYILVNNLLSIAQQQYLMRRHAAPVPVRA